MRSEPGQARQLLAAQIRGQRLGQDPLEQFHPIGHAGGGSGQGDQQACRIEFDLDYAFASKPLQVVLSPVFDKIADTLVDRFVQRAEQVYGSR